MQTKSKITLLVTSFVVSALGFGGGTFAWFQVLNTTNAALSGTIIGAGDKLQVGFRVNNSMNANELAQYSLTADTYETPGAGYVYWANAVVSAETMNFVVKHEGYTSDNVVRPITTGSFVPGENLDFYERPGGLNNGGARIVAIDSPSDKSAYVGFTMLFRMATNVGTSSISSGTGLEGYKIFFDYGTRFAGTNQVTQALRIGITNETGTDIIAPAYTESGAMVVGGVMDLNGDGLYDYASNLLNEDGSFDPNSYEIAYGEFSGALTDENWGTPSGVGEPSDIQNPNFYDAISYKNARPLINTVRKTAAYNTLLTYEDPGIPLSTTNSDGIAEINFVIWLEGWDHACVNSIAEATFGAQLNFLAHR